VKDISEHSKFNGQAIRVDIKNFDAVNQNLSIKDKDKVQKTIMPKD